MTQTPSLGRRGEGWVVAQFALGVAVVALGLVGPGWPEGVRTPLVVLGIAIGVAGLALLLAGAVALGEALTPFPAPSARSTLRVSGAYRLARHPIYGGLLLLAVAWSIATSPLALAPAALLLVVLELKSRREETLLAERHVEYAAYRRRVRWRFVPGVR